MSRTSLSEVPATADRHAQAIAQRDRWIRLFNRLEAAVARHRKSGLFMDDADDALHAAHDRVLKEAAQGEQHRLSTRYAGYGEWWAICECGRWCAVLSAPGEAESRWREHLQ